jgi:hypothetical protein
MVSIDILLLIAISELQRYGNEVGCTNKLWTLQITHAALDKKALRVPEDSPTSMFPKDYKQAHLPL